MCCNRNRNRNYVSGRANTCGSRRPGPLRLALLELVAHVQAKRAAKQQLRLQSEQDYAYDHVAGQGDVKDRMSSSSLRSMPISSTVAPPPAYEDVVRQGGRKV